MNLPTELTDSTVDQGISGTVGNLSGQKRPRDYGEELKGVSISDEDDNNASSPALKRQKTDGVDRADDSGLDDGEIVESSPAPDHGPGHLTKESVHDGVMNDFSEDGEIGSSAAEPEELEESNAPAEPFFIDKDGSKPEPRSGWNEGVSLGTRTSFGNAGTRLFSAVPSTAAPSDRDLEDRNEGEDEDEDKDDNDDDADYEGKNEEGANLQTGAKYKKSTTFTVGNTSPAWKYPTSPELSVMHETDALNPAFWVEKIQVWTEALLDVNKPSMAGGLSPDVIRTGFMQQYSGKPNLFKCRRNKKKEFLAVARKAIISVNLEALISDARSNQAKDTASKEEEELQLQRKYFPGVEDPSRYCLSCSGTGHKSRECPLLHCKFCESEDHTSFGCPTKQRCSKCRQLGHNAGSCVEKLALAIEEQSGCAFCGAEHIEGQCTEIWRSFSLSAETHRKVKDIPAFCYTCGAQGHYGPECGLPDRGDQVTGRTTWSQANRLLYVDPASPDIALAWVNVDLPASPGGEFHIRGRAKRPAHTYFVSSDESEGEDLIHTPVQRSGPRSEIRIASNIGSASVGQDSTRGGTKSRPRKPKGEGEFVPPPPPPPQSQSRRGRNNRGSSWQPPLPSGPPPSMPTNVFRGSLPSAALASLPPRPQTSNHGADSGPRTYNQNPPSRGGNRGGFNRGSSNGRGGRGGRGGGRGNGRGRGRGRPN